MTKKILLSLACLIFCSAAHSESEDARSYIQLNYNENPYGCFPCVKEAMANALQFSSFYADDIRHKFISQLALFHSVQNDQILISNGLSSILLTISNALIEKGMKIITADPTFAFFMDCVENRGGQVVKVPLQADYTYDLDAILAQVDANTIAVLICNPNNPTGTVTPRDKLDRFIEKLPSHVFVVIDEAYHEFAAEAEEYVSFLEKPSNNERVIVGRTFSKAYGLAGMRLGYVVSSKKTIDFLSIYYDCDNINVAALCGASVALEDGASLEEVLKNYSQVRKEFYKQLIARELTYITSYGNFVMFNVGEHDVNEVQKHFKMHGILIGNSYAAMPGFLRVTLGLPSQMEKFWEVWDLLPSKR